jgi:hypothetical protein
MMPVRKPVVVAVAVDADVAVAGVISIAATATILEERG